MERCNLTQVPCRKAISEVIKANKNRRSLQHTYEVAKLFQAAMSEEYSSLSEEDWQRYILILDLLNIKELRYLHYIRNLVNGLTGKIER